MQAVVKVAVVMSTSFLLKTRGTLLKFVRTTIGAPPSVDRQLPFVGLFALANALTFVRGSSAVVVLHLMSSLLLLLFVAVVVVVVVVDIFVVYDVAVIVNATVLTLLMIFFNIRIESSVTITFVNCDNDASWEPKGW